MKKLALAFALGLSALMCGSAKADLVAQPWGIGQGYEGLLFGPNVLPHNANDPYLLTQGQSVGTSASFDLIIGPGGVVTVSAPFQGSYDEVEDVAINVFNNSGQTLTSLTLTGPGIFGFDNDGIGTEFGGTIYDPAAGALKGYAGPDQSFSIVNANNGTLNFINGGLADGHYSFFSLEDGVNVVGAALQGGVVNAPLPSTAWTGLALLAGIGMLKFRRRSVAL